ncbi:MAG: ferrous iron transport protein A [Thermoflexales bacterium]|nr:ferrous iron transport protein A [Thermoflexales bacterium]
MTLDLLPPGIVSVIALVHGADALLVKARAIGLREGRSIEVLRHSGRLILARVGQSRVALTRDLAEKVQVQVPAS